ncbi:MAG: MBL fold metallo-hydrolase [Gemmatimonadetes bacterium]|nr:MBL fold metallo-hydrolase [Gemmatimonadota bacterium]
MEYEIIMVTPLMQNCTLLWDAESKKGATVDPGGDSEVILRSIDLAGVELEKVLLTHAHIDHVGAAGALAEKFGIPIEGPHLGDQFLVDGLEQQGMAFGVELERVFSPDRWLEQGDAVAFGGIELEVRHCPGHTPGHVIFYHAGDRLAITGDVLFSGSIGRTDFPGGDYDTLLNSIREQLWPLGEDVAFISGHGPMSTFGEERRTNPFVGDGR